MEIDTYNTTAVSIHTITSLSLSLSVSNSTHTQSFCQALGRPPTEKLTINSANRISLAPPPFSPKFILLRWSRGGKKRGDNL